jgi:hypothetical protein
MVVVEGDPRLGDLESGAVADSVSTQFSIVSGGVACAIGALAVALLLPASADTANARVRPADALDPRVRTLVWDSL